MGEWPVPQLPLTILEKDFQGVVIDYAKLMGWRVVHFRAAFARKGKFVTPVQGHAGSPDLLLARNGAVLLVELKRQSTYPSADQRIWLAHLGDVGRLWKPKDWNDGTITGTLRHLGRDPVAASI